MIRSVKKEEENLCSQGGLQGGGGHCAGYQRVMLNGRGHGAG